MLIKTRAQTFNQANESLSHVAPRPISPKTLRSSASNVSLK